MKIAFYTLGCRLNKAESDSFAKGFARRGFEVVDFKEPADIYVFNTCAVTVQAVRKSRQAINKIKNKRTEATIIATGCSIEQEDHVDLFIKNKEKLVEDVIEYVGAKADRLSDEDLAKEPAYITDRTRPMIKIQDGCDVFCTYCIISRRRGKLKSIAPNRIVAQIKEAQRAGFREVVLTGVNINLYSFELDGKKMDLTGVVQFVLDNTDIERIRFGSIDPAFIDDDFINLWKNPRLCNHWHLSLQSGSDKILNAMHRDYSRERYIEITDKLKEIDPYFGFTTDIIVGFPGETEEDFEDSVSIVERVGFSHVHVFPFSGRPGTPAYYSKEQLPNNVKKSRAKRLRDVSKKQGEVFAEKNAGRTIDVLFEDQRNGLYEGLTGNYLRIALPSKTKKTNEIEPVELKKEIYI